MTTTETSRYVRLRVELVLEVDDPEKLSATALGRIGADEFMPDDERAHAESAVQEDEAEAIAYLVEPFDLVRSVPGVQLAQASWSSEQIDYDPDSVEWDLESAADAAADADADDDLAAEDSDGVREEEEEEVRAGRG
ncbi:hypothetical protein KQY30_12935 [Streptomyces sp. GMY02]|uniref:hypothetical protein n=1 Tax=Streptomyces sp. GMY02 TaxID=1333528 RepID=UPI001C2BB404|nr:hypothetical protein [Streptomyces sp. GMY02]QXE35040.1 hypothetical protein KQY30_12935 [Streptomyces sp. GMY02]